MLAAVVSTDPLFLSVCCALADADHTVRAFDTLTAALDAHLVEPVAALLVDTASALEAAEWERLRQAPPALVILSNRSELGDKLAAIERAEREREAALVADRMDALRTLAHGAAHEINNPLAYNAANIQLVSETLLARHSAEDTELIEALDEAYDGALRVRDLLRDLRMFAQADVLRTEVQGGEAVELGPVIDRALRLAAAELAGRAQVVTNLVDVPTVFGTEALLGQLFLQLITNAARAIPPGASDEQVVSVSGRRLDDGRVLVEVADTGVGMTPEVRRRVFDPFFTRRPIGGGVGLGLSVCYAIAAAVRGAIAIDSAPGRGTTVQIFLTVALETAVRRRILVIDDEPTVTAALHRALGAEHDLVTVTNTRDGLSRIESGDYDAILCDVAMPEMSGIALYTELSRRRVDAADRMLFLAPSPDDEITAGTSAFLARMSERWIIKPIDPDGLRALLRRRWETGS